VDLDLEVRFPIAGGVPLNDQESAVINIMEVAGILQGIGARR